MRINKNRLLRAVVYRCASLFKDDRKYLETLFPLRVGYHLNLDNPQTYCEKLQWLKLYDRRPEYTQMVDKVEAKKFVAEIIGQKYIIPTLSVYDRAEEINFDALPSQFVLKCTHDSGSIVICKDKTNLNRQETIRRLRKGLKKNYFYQNREWPYKNVRPRIIAERYLENQGNDLKDYKFFCFHGIPRYCQVISNRKEKMSIDFFDENWIHQPFHEPRCFPFSEIEPSRPTNYTLMQNLASRLSQGHAFLRVDLYEIDGNVYFGELTFFPTSGMGGFSPMEWDYKFGKLIHLPEKL